MTTRPKAVIVHSFPRSGTHITIDFIRRNLVDFSTHLNFWESSSKLYLGLDERLLGVEPNRIPKHFMGKNLVAKSHQIDFPVAHRAEVDALLQDFDVFEIYPFRTFSRTAKSFAQYSGYTGPILEFLNAPENFFGSGLSVRDAIHKHATHALERSTIFLNVERLFANPKQAALELGRHLSSPVADIERRLPRRKLFSGRLSELTERLWKGRESTEVKIHHQNVWMNDEERDHVEAQFADLYDELVKRQLGGNSG